MVYEAMRVPSDQVELFKPLDRASDWLRFGPVGTKRRVARAAAWQSRAKRDVFSVEPTWTRKQPNGGHVQLVAISRPTKSPMVWWDPEGRPISGLDNDAFTSHADKEVIALVRVWEDGARRNLLVEGGTRSGHDIRDLPDRSKTTAGSQLIVVPAVLIDDEGRPSLKLGAGFGAWTAEAELKADVNATAMLGALTVTTLAGHEFKYFTGINQLAVKTSTGFRWPITRELDVTVIAVTKDGNKVLPSSNPTIYANDPPNTVNSALFIDHPLSKAHIDHFIVKSRPCHWTEFTGFAVEPAEPLDPPLDFANPDDDQVLNTPKPETFIAELPNGVRVEFVGLAQMEEEAKTWWKPDGTPLDEVPKHGKETITVSGQEVRRALLRVHGDKLNFEDVTAPGMTNVFLAESPPSLLAKAPGSGGPF
ncbi:MAG TPA: hypothetical protein VK137_14445, partial [Planctomycetaceae bacterium]|nr:hypothetical protein [Planctomycetaceae bacterium]